jgi:hypothetical protein
MSQVSRPMQIALAATVLLLAVWFVALRPKPSGDGGPAASAPAPAAQSQSSPSGAAPGAAGLGRAIDKARGAVTTANGDAQRAQRTSADRSPATPAVSDSTAAGEATPPRSGVASTSHHTAAPHHRTHHRTHRLSAAERAAIRNNGTVAAVRAALRAHKAVAIAFVDSATADSQAVAREMLRVSHFHGRALVTTVELANVSDYPFVTKQVEVTVAPTVVIVDRLHRATTIVGAADRGEIEQRLADALAVKPTR